MGKFTLFFPVRPLHVNQPFGSNPAYYAQFKDAYGKPEKGHMGVDFQASHGQPVYAAHDGVAQYVVDSHGGDGIYLRTNEAFDAPAGGSTYYTTIYWHLCSKDDLKFAPKIPADGRLHSVSAGDLIGYADNSGAPFESSGDHLHLGLMPCNQYGNPTLPANGYGGCIDPMPFPLHTTFICSRTAQRVLGIYTKLPSLLRQLIDALQSKKVEPINQSI